MATASSKTGPSPSAKPARSADPAHDLVIVRVFDAPRELVWRAWTESRHFKQWWGPKDFTTPVCVMDLRVGGAYLWCMRGPDGKDYFSTGVFREIVPMSRLVYTDSLADANGKVVPASYYGVPGDLPAETLVTVTFEDDGPRTRMTLRHAGMPAGTHSEMASEGWNQSFDKLAASLQASTRQSSSLVVRLPSDREILMTRVFDFPRRLVWEAHTTTEHIRQWWGPRRTRLAICEMDFRPGGAWRFVDRRDDGKEYGFRGVYREISPPERIVWTFEFDGAPGHVSVETLTLVETDGKTTLTVRSVFDTAEERDAMLQSGMEAGARETWERLAEYLEELS